MSQDKQSIITYCRLLYNKGLAIALDGNVSVLLEDETLLITPTQVSKGELTEDRLAHIDREGRLIEGGAPSSELFMHIECYKARGDIAAIVHAHPPYATALASTSHANAIGEHILLPEILLTTGIPGVVEYASPGSDELASKTAEVIATHNGALLKNHGVVAVGKDLKEAYTRLESIELYCKIRFLAESMGGCNYLSADEVAKLQQQQ